MDIDINTAQRDELLSLVGIGEEIADAIILRRPFESVDDLLKIPAIGPATLRRLKTQGITIDANPIKAADDTSVTRGSGGGAERGLQAEDRAETATLTSRFEAVFGPLDDTLRKQVQEMEAYEPRIVEWLQASPKNARTYTEDPSGTLHRLFPELVLQKPVRGFPTLPGNIRFAVTPGGADAGGSELFIKVWEYVSESEANTQEFERAPFAVIASVGSSYPQEEIDAVVRAFQAVFGIDDQSQGGSRLAPGIRDIHYALSSIAEFKSRREEFFLPPDAVPRPDVRRT